MWGGANEAKVDKTSEMYFLLSDPFIQQSSNTREIVTAKYTAGTEYYICRIQLFELLGKVRFFSGGEGWGLRGEGHQ